MNGAHRYVPRGLAVLAHGESNLHTKPDVRQQSREVVVVALRNLDAAVKVPSGDYRVSSLRLTLKDPKSGSAWGYIFGDNGGKASRWHRLDTSATWMARVTGR